MKNKLRKYKYLEKNKKIELALLGLTFLILFATAIILPEALTGKTIYFENINGILELNRTINQTDNIPLSIENVTSITIKGKINNKTKATIIAEFEIGNHTIYTTQYKEKQKLTAFATKTNTDKTIKLELPSETKMTENQTTNQTDNNTNTTINETGTKEQEETTLTTNQTDNNTSTTFLIESAENNNQSSELNTTFEITEPIPNQNLKKIHIIIEEGEIYLETITIQFQKDIIKQTKKFENTEIQKGQNKTYNLTEYFQGDKLFYDFTSSKNYDYAINQEILTIIAKKESTTTARVYASNEDTTINANEFNVTVIEASEKKDNKTQKPDNKTQPITPTTPTTPNTEKIPQKILQKLQEKG
ncbi:hypothetical protein K9L97_02115, partial [Candidatus Woesearchaeota archaeon]|nr:hypothetical protein [Candidatus Woesearchaeota archaeon]